MMREKKANVKVVIKIIANFLIIEDLILYTILK